ncbi:tripartite tricarboxylate transporter TctB family protein [Mobilicoccus sp.]|uniref:tripartite tricarboxylate transporter TctB family protein n=1 Tax=Mobilicoccus sp. TaxID=2034349 RepID=UPI0028B07816|nr:tripartite tricarboxylate transporter TctB family protein [Mobilicoccus sp.]
MAWCVGGFALFAATLDLLGWILGAAVLFWCVARGIGSTRPVFDASLALVVSSLVYLAFSVGLGLTLPSGLLGGGW